MTDELDPQTQQHIDDPADVTADTDAVTCDGIDIDDPILDESATAETPETENADEQNDDAPAQTFGTDSDVSRSLRAKRRRQRRLTCGGRSRVTLSMKAWAQASQLRNSAKSRQA